MNKFHLIDVDCGEVLDDFDEIKDAPELIRSAMLEHDLRADEILIVQSYGTLVIKDSIKLCNYDG